MPSLSVAATPLTAQQIQAVQSLTPAQMQQYQTKIQPTLAQLKSEIAAHQQPAAVPNWQNLIQGIATSSSSGQPARSVLSSTFNFSNSSGTPVTIIPAAVIDIHGTISRDATGQQAIFGPQKVCPTWGCGPCPPYICKQIDPYLDVDQDGLPDNFENQVADNFTPLYAVSAGEQDQFATFGDYVPMTVTSLVGTVPPYSYYRVQPLGLTTDANSNQVFALRIDYLTLWNADGGLVGGGPLVLTPMSAWTV